MSDRAAWLEEWCPECRAAPGARCCRWRFSSHRQLSLWLHCARGWRARTCPTCKAGPGEPCRTPSGRLAARPHTTRLRPARWELVSRSAVFDELERRGAIVGSVPFSGRAGRGGDVGTIALSRIDGGGLVDVERWSGRDELAWALEAPVWGRYGTFAGQPSIHGTVLWTVADRRVAIVGERGGEPFEEVVP